MTYLTPKQLADRWQCSERHIERLCASGRLRAARLSGWRITEEEAAGYEAAQANRPASSEGPKTEPGRPVFGVLEEGARRPLGERWWERETNDAASPAAGRGRSPKTKKTALTGK